MKQWNSAAHFGSLAVGSVGIEPPSLCNLVLVLRRALALPYLHFLRLYHLLGFLVFGPLPVLLVFTPGLLTFTLSVC